MFIHFTLTRQLMQLSFHSEPVIKELGTVPRQNIMEFDQGFIIRLNDHGKTVENIINHASHDVTLVCDGKEFLSNRIVLSACSPLLFSLLK